jgi:pimeloyl-ACP methyl ester carboxylesterase
MSAAGQGAPPRLNVVTSGDGPVFVFQHGLCGDAAQTAEVFPDAAGFRRVTIECRGHGQSEPGDPAAFSIATFSDDIVEHIEREALAPIVLGGISMGAAIALRIAVTRPDLVRALVIARPAWIAEAAPPNMQPYAEVGELLSRYPAEEARSRFESSTTAAELRRDAPDNLASLLGFFSRQPKGATSELLIRIAADGPGVTRDQVAAVDVPVLVIGHAKDEAHPLAYAEELAALMPRAVLVRITPKAESRERYVADFRRALGDFLARIDRGAGDRNESGRCNP